MVCLSPFLNAESLRKLVGVFPGALTPVRILTWVPGQVSHEGGSGVCRGGGGGGGGSEEGKVGGRAVVPVAAQRMRMWSRQLHQPRLLPKCLIRMGKLQSH